MQKKVKFKAGKNIAMKVPAHQYNQTVQFYRDVIGLPRVQGHEPEFVFSFGDKNLWIDKVDHISQSEIWLEIECDDVDEAKRHFNANKVVRRNEIEELPQSLSAFWISSPCDIIHLIAEPD